MSTAIETYEEEETAVVDPVIFLSTCNELRLVKSPQRRKQIGDTGQSEVIGGEDVKFREGRFEARDAEIIAWLQAHDSNGIYFHEMGFGADGKVSDDTPQLMAEIVELAFDGNVDRLADILLAERQTMSRPTVMKACEAAITRIEEGSAIPRDLDAPS